MFVRYGTSTSHVKCGVCSLVRFSALRWWTVLYYSLQVSNLVGQSNACAVSFCCLPEFCISFGLYALTHCVVMLGGICDMKWQFLLGSNLFCTWQFWIIHGFYFQFPFTGGSEASFLYLASLWDLLPLMYSYLCFCSFRCNCCVASCESSISSYCLQTSWVLF